MVPTNANMQQQQGSAAIAEVNRETFLRIVKKRDRPVVLSVQGGWPKSYKYFTQYGGFYFRLKSKEAQDFSREAEVIEVEKVRSAGDATAW